MWISEIRKQSMLEFISTIKEIHCGIKQQFWGSLFPMKQNDHDYSAQWWLKLIFTFYARFEVFGEYYSLGHDWGFIKVWYFILLFQGLLSHGRLTKKMETIYFCLESRVFRIAEMNINTQDAVYVLGIQRGDCKQPMLVWNL